MKTVSNVINGYAHVSEAMRTKVLAAIEEVGYQPNLSAVGGFDDIPYGPESTPTSISPDRAAVARAAVASLPAHQGEDHEPREIAVGIELVVRESTAGMTGAAFVEHAALHDATLPFVRATS